MNKTTQRRYEFDWLRIGAIAIVFLYHSTRFFNLGDWHVKNANTYIWVEMWNIFSMNWLMPLFFVISGASLFYALEKSHGFAKFYVDKFLRLMIPVLIATVTHSVMQVYLERLTHGRFYGSLFSFIPEYFNGVYLGIGGSGNFAFSGMHLWYLLFLFVFSLMCYRLFVWFKAGGRSALDRMTAFFALPGLMFLFFPLPLVILKALVPAVVLNAGAGAWGFLYYLWFLIAGFMIVSSDRLQETIKNQCWICLLLGIGLTTFYLCLRFWPTCISFMDESSQWPGTLIYFLNAWCWLFAILGTGMRFLAFDRPWLQKANEGVLPFYILHQSVLVGIGFFVMRWPIGDFLKWVLVFSVALVVIITLYIAVIRKLDLFRFLFGMKTTHAFYGIFRKKGALSALHLIYLGLIVLAIVTGAKNRTPMPLTYDPGTDVILDSDSIANRSSSGVAIIEDKEAAFGHAILLSAGANQRTESNPQVYVEMRFSAPKGLYRVWLRGKSDEDAWTDSVWLQVDDQIGSQTKSFLMGNWRDIYPPGTYAWAGNGANAVCVALTDSGDHTIRIQPRQIPHRIDQIWFSRRQVRIPDTIEAIK